jgi:hypothetical protein
VVEKHNELIIWFGEDRRIVMYPCNNNELLNLVCIHPEAESQGSNDGMSAQEIQLNTIETNHSRMEQTRQFSTAPSGL